MMSLTFYGYPKCGTCRNAQKWLKENGTEFSFIDITAAPPTEGELDHMISQSGLDIRKFFNTSGEVYRQLGLKDTLADMGRDEMLRLLSGNGKLIKRPLVTDGSRTTVGFDPAVFERVWQ